MNDKLYMTPIVGGMLFDKSIASITDNHGNRVSGWSASCANGHEEGYVLTLDKIRMVKQVEIAAFKDLIGTAASAPCAPFSTLCRRQKPSSRSASTP